MRQVLQDLSGGATVIAEVPRPACRPGHLLIRTRCSLISAGTERMLVDFGRAGWLEKARKQPDKVRAVIEKIGTDGLQATIDAVRSKLDQPLQMGYSNVGEVIDVGDGVTSWTVGDRVASNGPHAEVVCMQTNLCAKIPNDVPDDAAVFAVVGSIALQGIRLLEPTLGEVVVVMGLGLIGQITVQLLIANGCTVIGTDLDADKLELARECGAHVVDLAKGEDPQALASALSRGRGVDGIIVAASTRSDTLISDAAQMCRKRGRIVLVGVTGLNLSREDFYKKELTFQVSCSYGPGRYDTEYEEKGHDYPIGFVRWTEQRNMEAVLDMLAANRIRTDKLISRRFEFAAASSAYDLLADGSSVLGLVLDYGDDADTGTRCVRVGTQTREYAAEDPVVGALGAGNYASRVLLPEFSGSKARLKTIVTASGVSGTHHGSKLGFEESSTDADAMFADPEINTVVIATRHNTHAGYVLKSVEQGKHVFVEKPLALTATELDNIETAYEKVGEQGRQPRLMVGFNRRFSPLVQKARGECLRSGEPMSIVYVCNAGQLPHDHWTQDADIGGGRIIGEACHFIDLARFLADSPIAVVSASALKATDRPGTPGDTASITLEFKNGSIATIHYFANGNPQVPKEQIDVYQNGNVVRISNFRSMTFFNKGRQKTWKLRKQDKGQKDCVKSFLESLRQGTETPIPLQELLEVSRASVDAAAALCGKHSG